MAVMRRRGGGTPEPMQYYYYCASNLDRAIGTGTASRPACKGAGCTNRQWCGGAHARDPTKRGSCTCVRGVAWHACLAPARPPERGHRPGGGDRETRASPWHKWPRPMPRVVRVRPRSGGPSRRAPPSESVEVVRAS